MEEEMVREEVILIGGDLDVEDSSEEAVVEIIAMDEEMAVDEEEIITKSLRKKLFAIDAMNLVILQINVPRKLNPDRLTSILKIMIEIPKIHKMVSSLEGSIILRITYLIMIHKITKYEIKRQFSSPKEREQI